METENKEKINKELTELLGECWHEYNVVRNEGLFGVDFEPSCRKCGTYCLRDNPNYFTDSGYGKLRDMFDKWDMTMQMRFFSFIGAYEVANGTNPITLLHAFHRDNLAPLMLEFLKGEG